MSKFLETITTEATHPISKNQAQDAVTSISTNLDYLYRLFYSVGGGNNFSALNRFNMHKSDIERKLIDISTYLNKAR